MKLDSRINEEKNMEDYHATIPLLSFALLFYDSSKVKYSSRIRKCSFTKTCVVFLVPKPAILVHCKLPTL